MTKKEFTLAHIAEEIAMIKAWIHLRNICDSCIKAHREELRHKRIQQLVEMNRHLWEEK